MEVQEYIQEKLKTCSQYALSEADRAILRDQSLEKFLFQKITSKKFRKLSIQPEIQEKIKHVIRFCIQEQKPLRFVLSFGGYKLFRMPTAPEIDWAEFFTLAYYGQYAAPLLKMHPPGVSLIFSSADIVVSLVNNVSKEDTGRYFSSFQKLIGVFKEYAPANFDIQMTRLGDLFQDSRDFENALEPFVAEAREQLRANEKLAKKRRDGALFNINWSGQEDWSKLSGGEKEKKIQRAMEVIQCLYKPEPIQKYAGGPDTIGVFATAFKPTEASVVVGTTKSSMAKFWAGMGVLAKNKDGYADYVITPNQWQNIQALPHEAVPIGVGGINNLEKILVYPSQLNFSQQDKGSK